jgi:hypothetical protein
MLFSCHTLELTQGEIMKNLLMALLIIGTLGVSSNSRAAVTLLCALDTTPDQGWGMDDEYNRNTSVNHQYLFLERVTDLNCISPKITNESTTGVGEKDEYSVQIEGFGLGIRIAAMEALTIVCPTVRARALGVETFVNKRGKIKKGAETFYGVKATAAMAIGVDGAVFANNKGGICVLVGAQLAGFGAGVSFPKITFEKY